MYVKTKVKSASIKVNNNLKICGLHKNKSEPYGRCGRMMVMCLMGMVVVTVMAGVVMTGSSGPAQGPPAAPRVLSCYYSPPPLHRPAPSDRSDLLPEHIQPHLCTHINVAFASVKNKTIHIDNNLNWTLRRIIKIRKLNPNLKILLSIGGANNDNGFSEMVVDHASRKTFIKSLKSVLRNYSLDGIDLDWEFPAVHMGGEYGSRERQHFSQLLREIRAEYVRERRPYLLTVAVAAPQIIVDASYDIDQLNLYTDFVNIMTYDYHSFSKFTPFTGLNSPLYARPTEQLYLATLNINYTVQMYLDKGLQRDKMVVGIPTYAHTFTLVNANNTAIGSPASAFGSLGSLGYVDYPVICQFLKTYGSEVTVISESSAKVPYLYRNQEWVSYDTPESVSQKAQYIKEMGLRGGMIYSLNSDDHQGQCGEDSYMEDTYHFPLSQSARNVLIEETRQQS